MFYIIASKKHPKPHAFFLHQQQNEMVMDECKKVLTFIAFSKQF